MSLQQLLPFLDPESVPIGAEIVLDSTGDFASVGP